MIGPCDVTLDDLESLAKGAWVLGTGGGFSVLGRYASRSCKPHWKTLL